MFKFVSGVSLSIFGLAVLVVGGLVAFLINLWIIVTGAQLLSLTVDGNTTVLSAAIMGAAALLSTRKTK